MDLPWTLEHRIAVWNLLNTVAQLFEEKNNNDIKASSPPTERSRFTGAYPTFTLSPIVTTSFEYLGHFWESSPPALVLEEENSLFKMCAVAFWATCKVEKIELAKVSYQKFDLYLVLQFFLQAVTQLEPRSKVYQIFELKSLLVSRLLDSFKKKAKDFQIEKYISFLLPAEIVFYAHSKVMKYHSYPFSFFNNWISRLRPLFNGEQPIGNIEYFRSARLTIVHLICASLVSAEHTFSSALYSSGSYVSDNDNYYNHLILVAAAFFEGFSRFPQCNLQDWNTAIGISFNEKQYHQISELRTLILQYDEMAQSLIITQNK